MIKIFCSFQKDLRPLLKRVMGKKKWIKTEQMLEELKKDANNEHEYRHWLGGILRSTHWLIYDSGKNQFGDSTDWDNYVWYTEAEFLNAYTGHWWHRDV